MSFFLSSLVFLGVRGLSSSTSNHKRVLIGAYVTSCSPSAKFSKMKANFHPINVIMANNSSGAFPSREERALVVIENESQEKKDVEMGQLKVEMETDKDWYLSCLA